MGSASGGGGRRRRRPSSGRLRTLVGGFKAHKDGKERPRSQEIDVGWDEISHQITPTTALGQTLEQELREAPEPQGEPALVESEGPDRDSTPLRVDLSEFGSVPLPSYATDAESIETRMRDRFDAGDFLGALEAANLLLEKERGHGDAKRIRERAESVLLDMYSACLGPLMGVAYLSIPMSEVLGLALDHRAGFVLSQVDGVSSFEEILDVTGMPRLETMRILCDLLIAKVITLR